MRIIKTIFFYLRNKLSLTKFFWKVGAFCKKCSYSIRNLEIKTKDLKESYETSTLMLRELFKLRVSERASNELVIDKQRLPDEERHRVGALFFAWMALLAIGGGITALFSDHGALESFSGMFSALGNIGPCYISVQDMINIHPVVKLTYIFGMLAGRLEILPVLLIFSRKAWK